MKWVVYNALFSLAYALALPSFLLRMKRRGGYRARMGDRFGFYPDDVARTLDGFAGEWVWIHAVSVGEVQVAGQLMEEMRRRDPRLRFVFSTTSSTGWKTAEKVVGPRDALIYNPLDFNGSVSRALERIRPRAVILTETEIWPNFIRAVQARAIPLVLANARVSDRSAPRYRALRWFFGEVLRDFTRIYAQSRQDCERLVAAGADPAAIAVTGSFKFDVARRNPAKEKELREWIGPGPILLGGSTWPGEDVVMLETWTELRRTCPDVKLVIAPRHFEKADDVETNVVRAGFTCRRRSRELRGAAPASANAAGEVYLCDTTGEMMGLFGIARVAFVGKSLCAHGSQNMIEPCLCGVATVVGPYTENFRPVMSDLLDARALVQTADMPSPEARAAAVRTALLRFFAEPGSAEESGVRAREAVERRRGVTGRCAAEVLASLPSHAPEVSRRRRWGRWCVAVAAVGYALSCFVAPASIEHAWRYLQLNPNRTYAKFLTLSGATALYPWTYGAARAAYARIVEREVPGKDEFGVERFRASRELLELFPRLFPGRACRPFDARLASFADFKRQHEEMLAGHGGYWLWCVGRYDYVLVARAKTGGKDESPVSADDFFARFDAVSDRLSAVGIHTPANVMSCFVGGHEEIEPALAGVTALDVLLSRLPGRLAFLPALHGGRAQFSASRVMPATLPELRWFRRGHADAKVFFEFMERVDAAQNARREALVGFDAAAAGNGTNAVACWARAARVSPRDPLILNLVDALDRDGRRFLAIGNVKGAMQCYENRLAIWPNDVATVHNFGMCLKNAGHPRFAAQVFLTAAKKDPADDLHLFEFVECAAASGLEEEAVKALEHLVRRHPEDKTLKMRLVRLRLAILRKQEKENKEKAKP